ncbi:FtsW/RodA/SpoVE family cell cycle protein [Peribacillus alkalitolerans]|uniref:FtsW/RodA/SpoVE family cell cycle protein n=1 Tax=Peribacillus alkalitolerans TaxID=1550385 RepID=UPI0013D80DC5|nr:FtsW/RodA/SpoVE family cell cycle protein [Peribacillus alkalitolerans]
MLKRILKSYDYTLIVFIVLLSLFGLVMIYSASMVNGPMRHDVPSDFFYQKQKINLLLAFIAFLVAAILPYKIYQFKKVLMLIFVGSILILLTLFVFGHVAGNAKSWLNLGARNFQPAEFIKIGVIIYMSAIYAKKQEYINQFDRGVVPPIIFLVIICLLIAAQPDFGTAFIIFLIAATIIMCSGINLKTMSKLLAIGLFFAVLLSPFIFFLKDDIFSENRMGRIYSFLDPFKYEQKQGYQLVNSYIAIGSGGLKGVGLGESVQKYGYLPEPHTDFIMAVISEELGAVGVIFVIGSLALIVIKGYFVAKKCRDPFGSLLAIGISSMIGIQSCINLGGMSGSIPLTGVTLPFISYGGSSILLLGIAAGILVNVSMFTNYENKYKFKDHEKQVEVKKKFPFKVFSSS